MYVPRVPVLTLHDVVPLAVILPSSASKIVNPGSKNHDPLAIFIVPLPLSVITGIVPAVTFTVRVTVVAILPFVSVTL